MTTRITVSKTHIGRARILIDGDDTADISVVRQFSYSALTVRNEYSRFMSTADSYAHAGHRTAHVLGITDYTVEVVAEPDAQTRRWNPENRLRGTTHADGTRIWLT